MSGIAFEPLIPASLWIVLATASIGILAWYAWSRPPALSRMQWTLVNLFATCGTILVLTILLNPLWLEPIPPPAGKPLLTILLDRSASMRMADAKSDESRLANGVKIAQQLAKQLGSQFDAQIKTFAASTSPSSVEELKTLTAEGQSTDLVRAIGESLDGDRPQGQAIVLLSDGIHNAHGGAPEVVRMAASARAMAAPIFPVVLGGKLGLKDLELTLSHQQELAYVGQQSTLHINIRQRGAVTGNAEVTLLHAGKEIAKEQIKISPDGAAKLTFQVSQPKTGVYRYEVRCQQFPVEATGENNSSAFVLRTVDRPVRVLLLEGKPYWDAKFLMNTLAQNASLEIDGIIRVAEGRSIHRRMRLGPATTAGAEPRAQREEMTEVLSGLPESLVNIDKLNEYQVIVLGRDAEEFLTDEVVERIRTWISKEGGSLVCYRAAPVATINQNLARLMPVRWSPTSEERFRISLTGRGRDLNWISSEDPIGLSRMPSLASTSKPQRPTPLAVVLAQSEGNTQPTITFQPYGTGRVVAVEGAGMWRWAFLAPGYQVDEPIYEFLWQGLIRWLITGAGLSPGQNSALRVDRTIFLADEPATATYLVRTEGAKGEVPDVNLKSADGNSLGVFKPAPLGDEPGVYRVLFGMLPPGQYVATTGNGADPATNVAFDVRTNAAEQLDVAARGDLMEKIAEESGGEVLLNAAASDISKRFLQHLAKSRPLQIRRIPLWDKVWVLLAVVGCWAAAWGIRRSGGLI